MTDVHTNPVDAYSDEVLVERLYDLAAKLIRGGNSIADRNELARIDTVVYRRLAQTYSRDPRDPRPQPETRLNS